MPSIAPDIFADIQRRLTDIENEHDVRILYACESGSRAWGFESQDSDYDVRFIYLRPRDWYLSIDLDQRRDVIEYPINDELDLAGWDLLKTLQLFHKFNPPLNEWLISPIVYIEHGEFARRLREMAPDAYNPIAAHYHYLRMANGAIKGYLQGDLVRRKKYFYALRPLLAVRWIEQGKGVVPIQFDELVSGVIDDEKLLSEIDELLIIKRAGSEADKGPRFPAIDNFIETEVTRHQDGHHQTRGSRANLDQVNKLFRSTIERDAP